ncbi:isoprenoid synthase domain-containing protein [Amylocarpus encephaloides]|uniref:Isoprenoid synthase domain-containing protein n=1 Tax=Amylocarpus encephaloides TaxID=45428 RepID=A0A9P8C1K6_9HELO|nr:isoprenoid synthase domain-containing protein [Amylocarpus encephaloides]
MAFMPARAYPIIRKADPEDLARRMLPASGIPSGARFVAACFWAFLCIIDDLTEDGECADCINTCIVSLSTIQSLSQLSKSINNIWSRTSPENHALKDCKVVITAFHHAVSLTNLFPTSSQNDAWKLDFWREVGTVVQALRNEDTLHNRSFSMCEWMRLRILTISARPFMVLARAGLGLPTNLDNLFNCPRINQMQVLVQGITGLQNDILGWQKDHTEKNTMCAVEILIRDGMPLKEAFKQALESHNVVLRALLTLAECGGQPPAGGWDLYVRVLVGFTHAMAMWMLTSKRYRVMTENMKLRFEQTL